MPGEENASQSASHIFEWCLILEWCFMFAYPIVVAAAIAAALMKR